MSPKLSAFEPLQAETLRELIQDPGPCITIYLPPYRPGQTAPRALHAPLKDDLHAASQRLSSMHVEDSIIRSLLEPLRDFAGAAESEHGFHWPRVIYRSPDVLRAVFVRTPPDGTSGNVAVGRHFRILPALEELQVPSPFYILKLSKKRVSLLRAGVSLDPVRLPSKTPETFDEFLEMDRPDHDLENRSSVGGPARGRRIRFGSEDERETEQIHLADFYKAIDRAMREMIHQSSTPVVLSGVAEDTSLYRSVSNVATLLAGSVPGALPDTDLLEQACALVRNASFENAARTLVEAHERYAPARFLTDPQAILKAAIAGRVAKVFLAVPPADEDSLNRIAIETLRNSGEVLLVQGAGPAAVLRY